MPSSQSVRTVETCRLRAQLPERPLELDMKLRTSHQGRRRQQGPWHFVARSKVYMTSCTEQVSRTYDIRGHTKKGDTVGRLKGGVKRCRTQKQKRRDRLDVCPVRRSLFAKYLWA